MVLETAKIFNTYLSGIYSTVEKLKNTVSNIENNITLINEILALKEKHKLSQERFEAYCDGKEPKNMSREELVELKDTLESFSEEIPF